MRSAQRTSPAAYWASWADTLPMMKTRNPELAEDLLRQLRREEETVAAVAQALEAEQQVRDAGYRECPSWDELWAGKRPEQVTETEPGEWKHGWQYFAASRFDNQHRESAVLTRRASAANALLRS